MPSDKVLHVTAMLNKVYGTSKLNKHRCQKLAELIVACKTRIDRQHGYRDPGIEKLKEDIMQGILELQDATGIHREVLRIQNANVTEITRCPDLMPANQSRITAFLSRPQHRPRP